MIVPMKKVSLILKGDKKEETLTKLRKLGLVHIEISEGSGEKLVKLGEQITLLESAIFTVGKSKNAEKKADFITIVAWRQQAEFVCRYFSKGRAIGVEGSIQSRDYTDKEGNRRYAFEVVADRVFFVESKGASNGSGSDFSAPINSNAGVSYSSGSEGDFQVLDDDNDLPF